MGYLQSLWTNSRCRQTSGHHLSYVQIFCINHPLSCSPTGIYFPNFLVFQFAYTTLFGAYCSFLFIRTGSLFPPLIAHSFCNVMGLPQITAEMKQWPRRKYGMCLTIIFRPRFLIGVLHSHSYNSCISSRHWIIYLHSWPMDLFSGELVLAT